MPLPPCCFICCVTSLLCLYFFFIDPASTEIYTLSLHDALPIFIHVGHVFEHGRMDLRPRRARLLVLENAGPPTNHLEDEESSSDRKSTRLNSSHGSISYAVFCLKKKKKKKRRAKQRHKDNGVED